jgi:hypothetical protein
MTADMFNNDRFNALVFGTDGDDSPLQLALDERVGGPSGRLQEWIDRNEGTPEERRRLAALRKLWPKHLLGPLLPRRKGRTRGDRQPIKRAFERYAIKLIVEARAERLAVYATYNPPFTRLRRGELEGWIRFALLQARAKYPESEASDSEERIRAAVQKPERLPALK